MLAAFIGFVLGWAAASGWKAWKKSGYAPLHVPQ
jgi:hypothetical protein